MLRSSAACRPQGVIAYNRCKNVKMLTSFRVFVISRRATGGTIWPKGLEKPGRDGEIRNLGRRWYINLRINGWP